MMQLEAIALTDRGQSRSPNQDTVWYKVSNNGDARGLFVVADGMGGHQDGEKASQMAVEMVQQCMEGCLTPASPMETVISSIDRVQNLMRQAIEDANRVVHDFSGSLDENARKPGSTITTVFVQNSTAVIANVGDSRAYLLRDGELRRITVDHSLVEQLIEKGLIKPEERYDNGYINVLTRAVGSHPHVEIDFFTVPLVPGDRLLVCTDGLWTMLRGTQNLARHLGGESLEQIARDLYSAAMQAGGRDHISLVLAELKA